MNDLIKRQSVVKLVNTFYNLDHKTRRSLIIGIELTQRENAIKIPDTGIEDLSDGFHTFKQLYYQRMMLFATIVKQNRSLAWKSLRHEDGELCFGGGWFIVGIDTPEGSYTYHYENKYYDMFECEELECAKHWDGHTEKDVTRLLSLPSILPEREDSISKTDVQVPLNHIVIDFDIPDESGNSGKGIHLHLNEIQKCIDFHCRSMWIPVSERLPEEGEDILVTYKEDEDVYMVLPVNFALNTWYDCIFNRELSPDKILAWMPSPEPWKGEKE